MDGVTTRSESRAAHPATHVALLRGINVSGSTTVPMAELRALCAELGWSDVRTIIQSGNVVFRARGSAAALGQSLEHALEARFGRSYPVMVRAVKSWLECAAGNPFPAESESEPNRVMLALSGRPPLPGAVEALLERSSGGEKVAQVRDALWIHYASGAGRSKLSPALLDRAVGSPVTTRNWRTVQRIAELVRAR